MNTGVLRDIIMLGISLVLSGLILWMVAGLGQMGYLMVGKNSEQQTFKNTMQTNRGLQVYNDYDVSRDDVLLAIKKYSEQYPIILQEKLNVKDTKNEKGFYEMYVDTGDILLDEDSPKSAWNVDNIAVRLEKDIEASYLKDSGKALEEITYHARVEYGEGSEQITKLTFTLNKIY